MIARLFPVAASARALCTALLMITALLPAMLLAPVPDTLAAEPAATPFSIAGDPVERLIPAEPGTTHLYVIGAKGLYRGDASNENWQLLTDDPPAGAIVSSADGADLMLAGSHQQCGKGGGGTPLNRSTDGGATWQPVPGVTGLQPLAIWGKADLTIAADCAGPQISLDGGLSWSRIQQFELGRQVTGFAIIDGITERKVLIGVTGEGGTSQLYEADLTKPNAITVSAPLKQYFAHGALAGHGQVRVLAGVDGVWLSIDEGQNWALRTKGLEDVILSVDPLTQGIPPAEAKRGFGLHAIALDPLSGSHMIVGSVNGVFKSTNAGAMWTPVSGIKGDCTAVVIGEGDDLILVQTENGVFRIQPWS